MKMVTLALISIISFHAASAELTVCIKELRSNSGTIHYILFKDDHGYPDDPSKSVRKGSVKATTPEFQLKNLEPGLYALSFIHDENDNGKLDTTLGFPKEGFAFSKNPKVFFGPPAFSRSSFKLKNQKDLTIKMKYM
jgi:uncharacterized protein (DUF2141 family)